MARQSSCCCFSVRTGAMILATVGIIGGFINTLSFAVPLASSSITDSVMQSYEQFYKQQMDEGRMTEEEYRLEVQTLEWVKRLLPVVLGIGLAFALFSLAINLMLWYGAMSRKAGFMVPWLVICMIQLVIMTVVVFGGGIFMMIAASVAAGLITWVVCTPFVALGFYFWNAVKSAYQEINEEGRGYSEFGRKMSHDSITV